MPLVFTQEVFLVVYILRQQKYWLIFSESTVDVWFDLHGSGLREALYVSLNRIPSKQQVLSLPFFNAYRSVSSI